MMKGDLEVSSSTFIAPQVLDRDRIPRDRAARLLDISLIVLAAPYIFLVFFVIVILIVLDSKGPVFYRQARIGRFGRKFYVYKFRTMVQDADRVLTSYLGSSPEMKAEWLATRKLKNDPRVTRVGSVLRKLSLDELPQLWNILTGDMSLVGPRPIVDDEVERYGECFDIYFQVRPGLTGLWQVSGRNDITYEQRVALDEYYVRNRSLRLDMEILLKTVVVVLPGKGAY